MECGASSDKLPSRIHPGPNDPVFPMLDRVWVPTARGAEQMLLADTESNGVCQVSGGVGHASPASA